MKLFPGVQPRQEYLDTQKRRSDDKFSYCKVSVHDVIKYRNIIMNDMRKLDSNSGIGPILCLGTRNGREVDLFRVQFFGLQPMRQAVKLFERQRESFKSILSQVESVGRSDLNSITYKSVFGVEINPRAARSDVWIGSFDEMPHEWENTFGVLYSNSFDQSQDPHRTAREWTRVTRKGGYIIVGFSEGIEPTSTDPVGDLHIKDIAELFDGELIYFQSRGSLNNYSEVIIRV
ncbi:MAG: class I SAM-dependent methyltransferase [Chloroflexi bacterium]|nr:class I SAM-dependent methyltransferase [Chloroflexota bacterium]